MTASSALSSNVPALFSLAGRRALVTGASRGLGRAMAEALAGAGADVVCAGAKPGNVADTIASIEAGYQSGMTGPGMIPETKLMALGMRSERIAALRKGSYPQR